MVMVVTGRSRGEDRSWVAVRRVQAWNKAEAEDL